MARSRADAAQDSAGSRCWLAGAAADDDWVTAAAAAGGTGGFVWVPKAGHAVSVEFFALPSRAPSQSIFHVLSATNDRWA